jgi:DNA-binding NarL/FixJ family response regulator
MSAASPASARILVVDDHPVVRLGIRQMIAAEPGLSVCGEAESATKALELAKSSSADLAIVDLSLGDGSGLDLIRSLREATPELKVLVLSMHDEALFAERVLRAGAHGYIMKQEAIDGLVHAIQEVLAGRRFISTRMSQVILERIGHDAPASGDRLANLTDRELEVFELIGRGLNTGAIADRLEISVKTVETYRSNIRAKLDLKDATELIRYAATWIERP